MKLFSIFGELLLKDSLSPGLDKAEGKAKGLSSIFNASFGSIAGAALKLGAVLGVTMGFKSLFEKAEAGQKTMAQMDAVLKSTGGAAGMTKDALVGLASSQAKVTTFSAGTTKAAENLLLTFTGISKKTFPDTIKAAQDMSTAMGTDLNSSVMTLGKALNDPAQGLTKLTKQGVTFTDQQKKQVEAMTKAGNVAGAQAIMLKELQKEFGGSAEAAGKTFAGQLTILRNQLTGVGVGIVSKLLPPLTEFMTQVNNHMPQIQAVITKVVDFIGKAIETAMPIVRGIINDVIGIATKIFPSLGKSTGDLGNKILTFIGSVLLPIKNTFNDLFTFVSRHSPEIKGTISKAVDGISKAIQFLFPIFEDIVQDIIRIGIAILPLVTDLFPKMNSGASGLGGVLGDLVKGGLTAVKDILDWLANHGAVVQGIVIGIASAFGTWKTIEKVKTTINGVKDAINTTKDTFNNIKGAIDTARLKFMYFQDGILSTSTRISNFKDKILNGLSSTLDAVGNTAKSVGSKLADFGSRVADVAGSALSKMAGLAKSAGSALLDFGKAAIQGAVSLAKMTLELGKQAIAWIAQKAQLIATTIAEGAATVAQTALNLAMSLNPIAIIIIAIAGLVAAIVVLYNKNEGFRNLVNSVWNTIKSVVGSVVNSLIGFFHSLVSGVESAGNGIRNAFNAVINWFSSLPSRFVQFGSNMINGLRNGISSVMGTISGVVSSGFNSAISFITGLPGKALGWGKDFINGLINGIKSAIGGVVSAVSGVADKIKSFLHFSVPDEGPLTDYESWMPDFMGGLANGINKNKKLVTSAVKGLSSDMKVGMKIDSSKVDTNINTNNDSNTNKPAKQKQPIIHQTILNGRVIAEEIYEDISDLQSKEADTDGRNRGYDPAWTNI